MYVPGYLAYLASGYNIYWTYTIYKLIFLALIGIFSLLLYRLSSRKDPHSADRIALFVLANPVLLFISYIWDQYDIFPIVLFAFGYAVLRYSRPEMGEWTRLGSAAILLAMSILFYWFALILIPTLLLYTPTWKERLRLLGILSAVLAVLLVSDVVLFAGGLLYDVSTLLGASRTLNTTQSFGLQYFLPLSSLELAGLLVGVAFLLPLLLKGLHFDEPSTSFVLVTLLLFSVPFILPDNYILILPFIAFLAIARLPNRLSSGTLFGLLAYPIAGLLLINVSINNSEPDGVGIFYWGYELFHANIRFLNSYAAQDQFIFVFNVALALAVGSSLIILALIRSSSRPVDREPFPYRDRPQSLATPVVSHARRRRITLLVAPTAVLLCVAALLFNAYLPNAVQYDGTGQPPTYILTPIFWPNNGNIPRPIPGATYSQNGNSLEVYSTAPPMVFGRWYANQSVTYAGSIALQGMIPAFTPVINGSPFAAAILNLTEPDASAYAPFPHELVGPVANLSLPYPLLNRTTAAFALDGNASIVSTVNQTDFLGRDYAFAFSISRRGAFQTNIFHLQNQQNFIALVSYPGQTVLVYGGSVTGGKFVEIQVPGVISTQDWNYVEFVPLANSFWVNVDGATAVANVSLFSSNPDILSIGVPFPGGQDGYSLNGTATGVFAGSEPLTNRELYELQVTIPKQITYYSLPEPSFGFQFETNRTTSELMIAGESVSTNSQLETLYMGKFHAGVYSVTLTINDFGVQQAAPDRFYLIPVFLSCVAPFLALAVASRFRWI